jgi:hypothetical protein
VLVLAGVVGFQVVVERVRRWGAGVRGGVVALVLVASLFGAWVNASLALQYQREVAPQRSESERAAWLGLQQRLGGGFDVVSIAPDEPAPAAGPVGQLLVVGDCEALLRSNGSGWFLVENSDGGGGVRLDIVAEDPVEAPVALLRSRDEASTAELVVEPAEDGLVRLVVEVERGEGTVRSFVGPSFELSPGAARALEVQMDHRAGETVVRDPSTGQELLRVQLPLPVDEPAPVTGEGLDVAISPLATPRCEELVR